jgi:hypothetical protein
MLRFKRRQKLFNAASTLGKSAEPFSKKLKDFITSPVGIVSTGTLGMSAANTISNLSKNSSEGEYLDRDSQVKAMRELTKALLEVDNTISQSEKERKKENSKTVFRKKKKLFGLSEILDDVTQLAAAGSAVGGLVGKLSGKDVLRSVGIGTLIGGALGLAFGLVKKVSKAINNRSTVDSSRLMKGIIDNLKNTRNLVEGKDFTRDPKRANELKTRVCIVISKESGDLHLLINLVSDNRLSKVTNILIHDIKKAKGDNYLKVNEKLSDRYNEILITTVARDANVNLISGVIERYVKEGYPVYILEVG